MELNIIDGIREPNRYFDFELQDTFQNQEYYGREIIFAEPTALKGRYVFDGKSVYVEGNVWTTLDSLCSRCNEAFSEKVSFSFGRRFFSSTVPSQDSSDENVCMYSGDIIPLDEEILAELYLNLPIASVCKSDCKGLCSVCGANLNVRQCNCSKPDALNAFSVLLQQNDFNI